MLTPHSHVPRVNTTAESQKQYVSFVRVRGTVTVCSDIAVKYTVCTTCLHRNVSRAAVERKAVLDEMLDAKP